MLPLVDACRLARRPYRELYLLVVSGRVDAERRGTRWFVSQADVERLSRIAPDGDFSNANTAEVRAFGARPHSA